MQSPPYVKGKDNKANSATYASPPGAWNIDRHNHCDLETGTASTQKMALGTQMSIIAVAHLLHTLHKPQLWQLAHGPSSQPLSEGGAARGKPLSKAGSIPLCLGAAKQSSLLWRKVQ